MDSRRSWYGNPKVLYQEIDLVFHFEMTENLYKHRIFPFNPKAKDTHRNRSEHICNWICTLRSVPVEFSHKFASDISIEKVADL